MMVSALTGAQAMDMGIMEAAIRQATEANRRPLVMATDTVKLSNWEMQGATQTDVITEVTTKYLGKHWWEV